MEIYMEKYLTGSSGTGEKIISNWSDFIVTDMRLETEGDTCIYFFDWSFGRQNGSITIRVKDQKTANSSLICTNQGSPYPFDRPLGLYNDASLEYVFSKILCSKDIIVSGVYANNPG